LGRGSLTQGSDVIYRQLALFINHEVIIPTQLHLANLTPSAAQLLPSAKAKAIWLRPGLPPSRGDEMYVILPIDKLPVP